MTNRKKHNFRKLIQKSGVEKPSSGFSAMVMQKVHAEAEISTAKEEALASLLKLQGSPESTSEVFSHKIMSRIIMAPQPVKEEKIISNFAWCMIAAVFILLVVYLLLPGSSRDIPRLSFFSEITAKLNGIPVVYSLTFFAAGMLALLDYFLRDKIKKTNKV